MTVGRSGRPTRVSATRRRRSRTAFPSLLAASILPLSTAYSVSEFVGTEAAVDDTYRQARLFYVSFIGVAAVGAAVVVISGLPLISLLVATQVADSLVLELSGSPALSGGEVADPPTWARRVLEYRCDP